ncbi:MAG: phage/plasmid primase, P4 family [Lachnospiraceae bacterium]
MNTDFYSEKDFEHIIAKSYSGFEFDNKMYLDAVNEASSSLLEKCKDENIVNSFLKELGEYVSYYLEKRRELEKDAASNTKTLHVEIKDKYFDRIKSYKPEYQRFGDKANGELFAFVYYDRLRFNTTAKEWYKYDGIVWTIDEGGMEASRCAKFLYDELLEYAPTIKDESRRDSYLKEVVKLSDLNKRKRMIEDAKDIHCFSADQLDANPYLLNLKNCVLDLSKGLPGSRHLDREEVILFHDPDFLLSKVCNVSLDTGKWSNDWVKFIDDVMEGDKDKIAYLQKAIGYSLIGDTREETCFILYGEKTRNGKSTLVETIAYMLGNEKGYALNMNPETIAKKDIKDSKRASGDVARLKGCRFLTVSEPPKRMQLDEATLKQFTGGDSITARELYQKEFQFVPEFKLFMNTNYLPNVSDDTLFSSDRMNVIKFNRQFLGKDRDKGLKQRLRTAENLSGILNWCIDGYKLYKEEGLQPPKDILDANQEYREKSDKLGSYISERLIESSSNLSVKEVFEDYQAWCRDNGYYAENKSNFIAEIRKKNLWSASGTVDGRTIRNIIKNYSFIENGLPETDNPFV